MIVVKTCHNNKKCTPSQTLACSKQPEVPSSHRRRIKLKTAHQKSQQQRTPHNLTATTPNLQYTNPTILQSSQKLNQNQTPFLQQQLKPTSSQNTVKSSQPLYTTLLTPVASHSQKKKKSETVDSTLKQSGCGPAKDMPQIISSHKLEDDLKENNVPGIISTKQSHLHNHLQSKKDTNTIQPVYKDNTSAQILAPQNNCISQNAQDGSVKKISIFGVGSVSYELGRVNCFEINYVPNMEIQVHFAGCGIQFEGYVREVNEAVYLVHYFPTRSISHYDVVITCEGDVVYKTEIKPCTVVPIKAQKTSLPGHYKNVDDVNEDPYFADDGGSDND